MKYYLSALKKYAVFQGRASRREFWMFYLFNVIFMLLAVVLDFMLGTTIQSNGVILSLFSTGYFSTGYYLALLIPTVSIGVRRLHDVGKNGWIIVILYILVFLYPILRALTGRWIVLDIIAFIFNIYIIIAGIYIFVLLVSPGETKDNKFGLSPIKAQLVKNALEPGEAEIAEAQQAAREDSDTAKARQFGKRENFIESKRRKGILLFVALLVVLLVALAGTLIHNSLSLSSIHIMTISKGSNHTVSGDIKNESSTEFVNVKIKFGSAAIADVGTLLPYQQKTYKFEVNNSTILSRPYDIFIMGWNLIALIISLFLLIVFLVSLVIFIFWLRNPRKRSLQLTDVSISSSNSTKEIKGILVNNTGREFSNVKIRFAVYNDMNIQIGMADVIVENIQPHRSALFQKTISKKLIELGAYYVELIKITKT